MQNKNKNSKAILHGECIITSVAALPASAVEEKDHKGQHVIIANSEVTGNHHVIDLHPGVTFFKAGNERFMRNTVETKVRCVVANRHTDIPIAPGVHKIGYQQEYDYFKQAKANVRD